MKKEKKAQITIFIILALILIVSIALIFTLVNNKETNIPSINKDPNGYIQYCAQQATLDIQKEIIKHGGFKEPINYRMFNSTKVVWMCYTDEEKKICTNNHPMLSVEIQNEILNYIKPIVENCFSDLKKEYSRYNYKEGQLNLSIQIIPEKINININKNVEFTKAEEKKVIEKFNTNIPSPLYNFITITSDIINEEVSCSCNIETCNADIMNLNRNNNNFEIERFVSSWNEKIYTLREINSGMEFNFAIRNCIRLP